MDGFNLQEELLSLSADLSIYHIPHELDVPDLSETALDAYLSTAIESIVQDADSILFSPETTLDVFRSILKHADAPAVDGNVMQKTLDAVTSSLVHHANAVMALVAPGAATSDDVDAPLAHKQQLEIWAFLLQWLVLAAEKGAGKSANAAPAAAKGRGKKAAPKRAAAARSTAFVWVDHVPAVLAAMHKTLRIPTTRIWRTTSEREAFVSCFTRPAYQLCETEAHLKAAETRLGIYKVVCLCVKFHGHAFGAQTSVVQNLTYFEHLSEPMAELLAILEKEFDHAQLAEEVLREVAGKSFAHNDAKGPRSFSKFLVRLAELCPRIVQKQMPLLLAHLDGDAHPMRMAIVEIIGILIKDISASDDGDEEQKNKQIKRFFEILFERFLDLNSYVRSKVLTTLIKLCDLPTKFPKQRTHLTDLTIRTLEDKTSSARRYAIQLLCRLLETHPFGALHGGTLNLAEWTERYEIICKELEKVDTVEMEKARRDAGMDRDDEDEDAADKEGDEDEDADKDAANGVEDADAADPTLEKPKIKRKPRQSQLNIAAVEAEQTSLDAQTVLKLRLTKKYYSDALRFITQIESAIPTLCQLLVSTNKTEVLESMRFFRTAYEYNISSADQGIKTMLHLIWTKDVNATTDDGVDGRGVRAHLIDVYRTLYFDVVPDLAPKQQVSRIAKNMIERTYGATLAELTSLEEMMRTMMADGAIHGDVINKLWQVYSADQEIPRAQRQGAIIILGMLALAKKEVVTERVDALLKIGLGPLGMNDLVLARYTCIALQRLGGSAKKVKGSLTHNTMRLPMDNAIFQKLQDVVEFSPRSPQWFSMAEQAVNTIYLLGEQPDALCSSIIKNLTAKVFSRPPKADGQFGTASEAADAPDTTPTSATVPPTPGGMSRSSSMDSIKAVDEAGSFDLAQLVFVVGHVAIKHIVYLELVEREFKRRKDETAKEKAAAKAADKDGNDLDAVAGNAEDDIGDLIAGVREKELLYGDRSLLAVYGPLVASICASPKRYRFCEAHLLLLFKILETSRDPVVRSNIVIALGDIAVCWGSMIDDNSERLYQGLGDVDASVKKNTLMVLTHLILNGMIKVKGQLGEMAKCLEDKDERISDLAKLFFTELSTKDNALYNNLQDVISHLSIGAHAVDEETFERTMRFIFTFIEKASPGLWAEKQAEAIVEKLCQRFRLATEERQWRDISFCLALLPFKSERSVRKLIEGLPFYQDKLHEETVFRRFTEILAKARANKSAGKPETELKEFEAILAEHQAKGLEDQALEADVLRKTKAAKRRAAKRPTAGSGAVKDKGRAEDRAQDREAARAERRPARSARSRRKVVESESEDEDGDDE